ncbi:TonB-dependent receptor [Enterovirga rhinocerotis]|uniref:Iron complex outermembrane receptor protein n=1 Tax=Enterovirga rhinocerotis TaxID=1339210 RepID=A0A4R7CBQ1_9HYPH|nr:TonB-dependent receptor [Enterovirga rhinocerotis]TDR94536.1 iron complex outermembrane receptor protein [Enterovirga rhinocerotis]
MTPRSSALSLATLALLGLSATDATAQGAALPPVVVTEPARPKPVRRAVASPAAPSAAARAQRQASERASARAAARPRAAPAAPPASAPAATSTAAASDFQDPTLVTRTQIERTMPTTIGGALADRPGVSTTGYAPGSAERPILRGLDSERVRIQENGLGSHDVSALGEDHAVPINPLVQDRIEIVRGPEALRYGSQVVGGIVNAENNRIPTFIPQGGYQGRVLAGYATGSNASTVAASMDAGANGVAIHADGFRSQSDDYRTPRGRQFNSAGRSEGGAIGISLIGDGGFIGIGASHSYSVYGIPGGEAAEGRTKLNPVQEKVYARGERRFEAGPFSAFRFWLGSSTYRHDETSLNDEGFRQIGATFRNREVEARAELDHVPVETGIGILKGTVGIQAGRSRIGTAGEAGGLLSPANSRTLAGYLVEELSLGGGLKVQAAGRIETTRVNGLAGLYPADYLPGGGVDEPSSYHSSRRFTAGNAALGLVQALPYGFEASLTALHSERAPTAQELYSRGAHEATATFVIGDPNLKLERAQSLEIGLRRKEGAFRLDATAFYTRYRGFIAKVPTGATCDDDFSTCGSGDELTQVLVRQMDATFWGAEIAGQLDLFTLPMGVFGIEGQYDFVHASFGKAGPVPRIPAHRLGGGVFWRDGGWFARVNLLHAFDQNRPGPYDTPTKGWNNLRAELSYTQQLDRAATSLREITLGVRGNNLLDDDMRNAASFRKDLILLPGRTVSLFVSAKF